MGRPSLPVGTWGEISYETIAPRKIRARARYRDLDGKTRPLSRCGKTKTQARERLTTALHDRTGYLVASMSRETHMRDAAERWVTELRASDRAVGTVETWERVVRNKVIPNVGDLRLYEFSVPVLDAAIGVVRERDGHGAARTYKTVLSGIFAYVVRQGVLPDNPVSHTSRLKRGKDNRATRPKALTVEETADLLTKLDADAVACEQGVTDLARFMLGTGVRIGEALGARWRYVTLTTAGEDPDAGLDTPTAGTLTVAATTTEKRGHGTIIQDRVKSEAGYRTLALPRQVVDMLAGRQTMTFPELKTDLVFPNPLGHIWPRDQVSKALRAALDRAGYPWVTSHTFRRTVATRLDDWGASTRLVADQLGHSQPSLTQDRYMGRDVVIVQALDLLPD